MPVVYYVTHMDPRTGFLKRVEFDAHEDMVKYTEDLTRKGIKFTFGHFER